MEKSNQIVGNAGLYLVCYELSKRGWNVLPTSRNARGVDIIIYNHDAKVTHTIQVKSLSKRNPVPMGTHLDHLIAEYLIICCKVLDDAPEFYIVNTDDIKDNIHRGEKEGRVSYWLQPKEYAVYLNNWSIIGEG